MISAIVTMGYGSWSTVNRLPTLGYSIGVAAVTNGPFRVVAVGSYTAGPAAAEQYCAGLRRGGAYLAGAEVAQVVT